MWRRRASVPWIAPTPAASPWPSRTSTILEVRGSRANPYTAGVICAKVARDFPAFTNGDDRILTPLRRTGAKGEGRFQPISWDEALDVIHARVTAVIAAHGPQAVLPLNYAGPHGMLAGGSMDLRFFHKLGASLLDRKPLCGGIRAEAWMGTFGAVPGMRPEQVALSKLVVAWGNNVTWSNLHLMPLINKVRRGGGKLVVVDPVRTKVAEQADLHLALRPGTDLILAWALTAELERRGAFDRAFIERHVEGFEAYMERARAVTLADAERIAGVPAAQVRQLAEWYHTLSPAAISVGNGLERNQNGGNGCRAIFALPALAGKLGVPGGGLVNGASQAFPKTMARLQRPDLVPAGTRTLNIVDVGAHLLDPDLSPPIKALFIYNHNPVIVHPDQNRMRRGLLREDLFTVGADVVMTDSMAYCDVVLPAATHFEYHDLYAAYGTHWLQRAEPVIRPRGESQPNTEIFRRLAARFGFTDPAFTASDAELMDDAMDASDPRLGGVRPSALPTDRALAMTVGGEDAVMFVNVFPKTASGKIELASSYLDAEVRPAPALVPALRDAVSAPARLARVGPAHHVDVRQPALERRVCRRSRCTPTTRGRGASSTACGSRCGTIWARSTCRSPSRTRCGRAWCPRSRARGSRRATMARRSPRSRPATTPTSPGAPATTTRASRWPPTRACRRSPPRCRRAR